MDYSPEEVRNVIVCCTKSRAEGRRFNGHGGREKMYEYLSEKTGVHIENVKDIIRGRVRCDITGLYGAHKKLPEKSMIRKSWMYSRVKKKWVLKKGIKHENFITQMEVRYCIELADKGKTIEEIVELTGIGKKTLEALEIVAVSENSDKFLGAIDVIKSSKDKDDIVTMLEYYREVFNELVEKRKETRDVIKSLELELQKA